MMKAANWLYRTAAALLVCLTPWGFDCHAADPEKHAADPEKFVRTFCLDCHHADDPSGDRDFQSLDLSSTDADTLISLQEIIDQLTLGAMPPEDAEQPSTQQRGEVIDALTTALRDARQKQQSTGGQTVLRRMTRREYLATVADLFAMDLSMFDPTDHFPQDQTVENLDNIGDALVTSGYLLEQYLDAADQIVEKVFRQRERPTEQQWHFTGDFRQQPELDPAHKDAFDFRYLCLYDSPLADKPEGAYGPLEAFHDGVPADGTYQIRVLAQALHRDTPYDEKHLRIDLSENFRMGIRPGDPEAGSLHNIQPLQPLLAEQVIEDGEPQWYTFQVPLDRGFMPRFTFENGLEGVRSLHNKLFRLYSDTLPERVQDVKGIFLCRKAMLRYGKVPQIRIHEVHVRGPIVQQWPSDRIRTVLPDGQFDPDRVRELVQRFADRAYRRPATSGEVDRLMAVYQARLDATEDAFSAFKDTLKVMLCSPSFLYLDPGCETDSDQISQHALASRLSYFLTGSMPDAALRRLADQGDLDRDALVAQTRRLLASDASQAMISGFTDAWLNLRALGGMPPDRNSFWRYYALNLQPDMKRETQLFLRHLIDDDRPVTEWLTGDYSFINRDLAKLYDVTDQVPVEDANEFRKVTFTDNRRGGLLGQASVLTVSANGIETSPVIRGVWMLENVLGTPPPPPPDDVPAIDPDVRGAKSIRDLLQKHRSTSACNECHRKIDPLGFALECFDPIGAVRQRYDNRAEIDTSGKLPSGQSFQDVVGLKELLVQRQSFFARSFAESMTAYALGRRIETADRGEIDALLEPLADQGYPVRSIIEQIVLSDLFQRR
ncbi:DUF1592 domain-containing protein [Roseiconus nitratireducens]|uniref:DUF1592 domain-containing protein n=1 Tax=Roseiconus nitratireducens TaxID=2605748 RepID=A0A5M6DCK9_9BACT|nr:DUF1592 domain-containing protein [Roseiconus nitratireducens]KAA5545254.1 DUF1592 domain-containing protein [Roseiconus nitratireducens]